MRTAITDLITSGKLVALGERNGQMFYTTKEMQELERQLVQRAENMAGKRSHGLREATIKESVTAFNHQLAQATDGKAHLTDNQLTAIVHVTRDAQLASLVGVAGAGKTTIMQVVKDSYERHGYRVRGAALSGIAAGGLKESGIQAGTLHALEFQIKAAENMKRQQSWSSLSPKQQAFIKNTLLTKHDVLIIDEAGMVGTRQLASIMERAQKAGAKVILCGDHEQLQSIEAGAAFRTVVERTDYADITEVRRQKTDWMREATVQFAKGDTVGALRRYAENSHLHHAKDKETALSQLVADYMYSCQQNPDQSRMVLAYTRKDVTALNKAIKAEMVKAGKVSRHSTDLTITTQQDEQETQGFATGDRIMFRENNRDLGVMNGTLATITQIHGHIVDVRLDNGQALRFNAKDYSKFQLGYAATVHKSQGVTVDEAFVLASRHFDRHTAYVAMTRHKHNVRLYAGREDFRTTNKLIDSLSKDGRNISSLDFAAPAPSQMGKRKQSLLAHKRALTRHHRKEREALAEQQKQRRLQEHAAHKAMQPKGLKAVWQRVTGQDKQLRERIKQDTANRRSRETQEKQTLIQRQLQERQKLQKDITAFRIQARQDLLQMRQSVARAMEIGEMPEYLAPQTPEMQLTQQHRPEMGM